jgi:hypothetical protein
MPTANNAVLCDLFALLIADDCTTGVPDMSSICSTIGNGISCDNNGNVLSIDLTNTGYNGVLPANIGDLRHLTELRLPQNGVRAPLPASFASLTELRILDISNNELGVFDTATVRSGRNLRTAAEGAGAVNRLLLEGGGDEVFAVLGQLTNLEYLDVSTNNFRGAMTDSLCELSSLETLYLSSLEEGNINENNFTCVSQCFYLNPDSIDMRYDSALSYCGQTSSPTVSPSNPQQSQSSSSAGGLDATQMGGLIGGLIVFVFVACCILYYFTCYSNTSAQMMNEDFMTSTSYVDVDMLSKKHLHTEPSIGRIFEDSSLSGFESSGSDSENVLESHPSRLVVSSGKLVHQKSTFNDDSSIDETNDEVLKQWNEELADFQRANSGILLRNMESFRLPAGKGEKLNKYGEEVDSDSDCNRIRYTVENLAVESSGEGCTPAIHSRGSAHSIIGSSSNSDDSGSGMWNIGFDSQNGSQSRSRSHSRSDVDDDSCVQSHSDVRSGSDAYSECDVYVDSSDGEHSASPFRERLDVSF